MTKVASLYHERKLRQTEIAARLHLSQATISRLLRRAEAEGIVTVTVHRPLGAYPDLERALEVAFDLREAIVVEPAEEETQLLRHLGEAGAFYLETTLDRGEVIGVSSWSETLLAVANAMQPLGHSIGARVVQILGGVGDPSAESHALQLTRKLATLVHGEAVVLPAPGVLASAEACRIMKEDGFVADALAQFDRVSLALVGIGAIEPSRMLQRSGNVFSSQELAELRAHGAVGDICLRFFDLHGNPVITPLNDRVIGMELGQFRRVRRVVGVAGGSRKHAAILGALQGRWINVLVTDRSTAEFLLDEGAGGGEHSDPPAHGRR